jgi:hypothetical protein
VFVSCGGGGEQEMGGSKTPSQISSWVWWFQDCSPALLRSWGKDCVQVSILKITKAKRAVDVAQSEFKPTPQKLPEYVWHAAVSAGPSHF